MPCSATPHSWPHNQKKINALRSSIQCLLFNAGQSQGKGEPNTEKLDFPGEGMLFLVSVVDPIPLLGLPLHGGRCSRRTILHPYHCYSFVTWKTQFSPWSHRYSAAPSPAYLPVSLGSCQPSTLCSVRTIHARVSCSSASAQTDTSGPGRFWPVLSSHFSLCL